MIATMPRDPTAGHTVSQPIHQLYVTHCLYDEGVTRQAGFTVRAASTRDPLLLRFAQEYPPFEPPAAASDAETACRLALVRIPGGSRALIHSVPLLGESQRRANNFFSHVLVSPSLTVCEALRLWDSPDWALDCPPATGKELDPSASLLPGPIDDQALTDFMQPDLPSSFPLCPDRLRNDARRRRELLSLTLRGCLLALREPAGSPRGRFFILAEPRLTALLVYGAMRLLPPHLSDRATFSTYESLRPSLRTYALGQIVGTWSGQPDQKLDDEFFTTRGYALDTVRRHSSPELLEGSDPPVDDWLDLAAQGDWNLLDTVYRLLGNTATSAVTFQQGFQAARLTQRLARGKAVAADLISLNRSPLGGDLLKQHRDKVLPLVCDASLPDAVVRQEFGEVLSDHIPELERKVSEALQSGSPEEWQPSWRLLKIALADDSLRLRDSLGRILPPPPYTPSLRFSILLELQGLHLFPHNHQLPLHALLRQCSAQELARFALSGLPREWYVWALYYSLVKGEAQAEAVRQLYAGDDALLGLFWEQFRLLKEEPQRRAILAPLFGSRDAEAVLFFSRSLPSLVALRPETLEWLLGSLGAFGRDWAEFWCSEEHIPHLLTILRAMGEPAGPIWNRLLAHLDADMLLAGSPFQRTLLTNLAGATSRPDYLPPAVSRAVSDHVLLREHFEKASAVPPEDRPEILAACERLGYDTVAILRRYFGRFVLPHEMSRQRTDDFVEFFHSFSLDGDDYPTHGSRLVNWREVVSDCQDAARREAYLTFYLEECVPLEYRARLGEEVLRIAKIRTESPVEDRPPVAAAPVEVTPEVRLPADDGMGYQLTGVHQPEQAGGVFRTLFAGSPWLMCSFASGLLALSACGFLDVPPQQKALACSFIPLILALSEGMALQAVAGGVRQSLPRALGVGVLRGACLGALGGAFAGGAAFLFGAASRYAFSVGVAVASGMLIGSGLSAVLSREAKPSRLAIGPITRTLAAGVALATYVVALHWLFR